MTMTDRHSLSNRVLAGASTIALAAGATLAGAGAAQAQTDSLEGSLSPDRCLGVNPATGLPGYANVYIGGDHDPGQAWITVVSGSTNIVPPMLLPDTRRTPSAMARATGSLTAPYCSSSSHGTPSSWCLASFA